MKIFNIVLAIASLVGATSCASINNPEGGPKDEKAPTLESSNPKHKELNVKTQTITLDFDEEVQQNSLAKELLITPYTDNKYKIKTSKTRLELVFEEPFEENTTYTFNFRKGIEDITEKNKAEALRLTFSTGNFIDSSRVSGVVLDLLKQQPEKEAIVALYPTSDTLSIRKSRPYYQTQTNEAGEFVFENIKEGEYRIFALTDKNNSSTYDNENERIAYKSEPIQITSVGQELLLETVKIDTKRPILQRREKYLDRFVSNYNEGIESFIARPINSPKDTLVHKISADGKIIELFGDAKFKGGMALLTAMDSAANRTIDTVQINFEGKRAQRIQGAKLKDNGASNNNTYSEGQSITIELETPVRINFKEPIAILADSILVTKLTYPNQVKLDRTATELSFVVPRWKGRNRQATVILDSVGIAPVQGDKLKFTPLTFTVAEAKGAGSLKGSITSTNPSYIVQLLDNQYKVKRQIRNAKSYDFKNIEPGTYYIRIIVDENKNGKWDGGDPNFKRPPEKVYLHKKALEIRANWEVEENIKF
ncbi:Ig-like domain-containing protein [Pontibacter sp. JH31]|uniref:Ig-like domain-containing protein n=1 Tax=Pontibacter aquaedesilientis TaxID=2766980 RepID=A0ABR7XGK1_9BACT|nr:Ig-like domain-containing domain [Pontibacter aquaedesilientis]MBD1397432.1 Ig-like domain-containing protein [Pontibacter aquaedesilientis]